MARKMAPPMRTTPMSRIIEVVSMSDLDVDDLLHPEEADGHADHGDDRQDDAGARLVELPHVLGVDEEHDRAQTDRQEAEHDGAHATLGGERADVPPQPLASRHRLGDREEQLRQVATDLP